MAELPPPSVTANPPPSQLYTAAGPLTPVAVTLLNVAAPPVCSCRAKVPVPAIVTLLSDTPLTVPSTHWTASNGLCSISALVTLIGPVTEPWLPSNHSAPTPNCQFGSRSPSRIMVLLEIVVVPTGVDDRHGQPKIDRNIRVPARFRTTRRERTGPNSRPPPWGERLRRAGG